MDVEIYHTKLEAETAAANHLFAYLADHAQASLGAATGATYNAVYRMAQKAMKKRDISLWDRPVLLLDEYLGLPRDHPQRFMNVIRRIVCKAPHRRRCSVKGPDVDHPIPAVAALEYDAVVESFQIGLQLLGVGRNGHIGFNEPGSSFESRPGWSGSARLRASTTQLISASSRKSRAWQ